jgi:tRNA 2-thiouridine synthesizing protein A
MAAAEREQSILDCIDARGARCPIPVLRTKQAIAKIDAGSRIHVMTTDPHSPIDLAAFAARSGCPLIEQWQESGDFHFIIQKGE